MAQPTPQLLALTQAAAAAEGLPWPLLAGLVQAESNWNPAARSPAGALGLTQVMPGTALDMGFDPARLMEPETSLKAGAKYLAKMLKIFEGDPAKAAAAYNHGPGTFGPGSRRNYPGVLGKLFKAGNDWGKAQAHLPVETRKYWKRVLNWSEYFAGRTSYETARLAVARDEIVATVSAWAGTQQGRSSALMLLMLLTAGALILLGRPK